MTVTTGFEQPLWRRTPFVSRTGLKLEAFLADVRSPRTVVHVHGACGNVFSAGYIERVAAACNAASANFMTINTSGHDCIAEGYRGSQYGYVGGSIADFKECVDDIQGAIDLVKGFSNEIVLVGHSLGCDRVVYYSRVTGQTMPLVLVSPCDSYRLHQLFLNGRSVEDHAKTLRQLGARDQFDLLPVQEYGIHTDSERYFIPAASSTLLSIIEGPPFSQFRQDLPCEFYLESPCLVCIGGKDGLQTSRPHEMFRYMSQRFKRSDAFYAPDGDHEFSGSEEDLSQAIVGWMKTIFCISRLD